ncbi:hypothetical protein SAMN05421541_109406 [Actinoplanes philippinensis]|uniref:Uncharacterized protein n=1 Tax=Actinoplanes philippinensis TaxID=35752 RepID=A0A1I2IB59_9ACTN|nr:hypothetical protein [Actinoplanes philippinensis]SFF38347.1 hypothetical protein SAMN05421541_109406 [Actinoplanes philippinensis]
MRHQPAITLAGMSGASKWTTSSGAKSNRPSSGRQDAGPAPEAGSGYGLTWQPRSASGQEAAFLLLAAISETARHQCLNPSTLMFVSKPMS